MNMCFFNSFLGSGMIFFQVVAAVEVANGSRKKKHKLGQNLYNYGFFYPLITVELYFQVLADGYQPLIYTRARKKDKSLSTIKLYELPTSACWPLTSNGNHQTPADDQFGCFPILYFFGILEIVTVHYGIIQENQSCNKPELVSVN